jgi:hypothetical protein
MNKLNTKVALLAAQLEVVRSRAHKLHVSRQVIDERFTRIQAQFDKIMSELSSEGVEVEPLDTSTI